MRFSNRISEYSQDSVPSLNCQESPADQLFAGGDFALSFCYIGKAAGLFYCSRVFALFVLWFFWLWSWPPTLSPAWSPISASGRRRLVCLIRIFRRKPAWLHTLTWPVYAAGSRLSSPAIHSPALRSIGIRCFFRLRIRPPTLSPIRCPALSPTHPRSWGPGSASGQHWPVCISRRKSPRLHTRALSIDTSGSKLSSSARYSPALGCCASALVASAASTLHCHASTLPAPDVLVRAPVEWTIRTSWSPEVVRLYEFKVCAHSRPAGHSASPSGSAAATATASAHAQTGKRLRSQNRHCQHNNDCCFESCLFHFRFLS
jgi:hypothetical protein